MAVKLKRYIIDSTRSISGKTISTRYGYVISVKRHWWKIWRKPRYLCLLPGWFDAIVNDTEINVQLAKRIPDATTFVEDGFMNYRCHKTAERIIELIQSNPERFIIA